jgi:hypothetical protein
MSGINIVVSATMHRIIIWCLFPILSTFAGNPFPCWWDVLVLNATEGIATPLIDLRSFAASLGLNFYHEISLNLSNMVEVMKSGYDSSKPRYQQWLERGSISRKHTQTMAGARVLLTSHHWTLTWVLCDPLGAYTPYLWMRHLIDGTYF